MSNEDNSLMRITPQFIQKINNLQIITLMPNKDCVVLIIFKLVFENDRALHTKSKLVTS